MKTFFVILFAIVCAASQAADTTVSAGATAKSPRQVHGMSVRDFVMAKRYGGMLRKPETGRGLVQVVNQQQRLGVEVLQQVADEIARKLRIDAKVFAAPQGDAQITLTLVDEPTAKALTVYPDEGQAVVNVAALAGDAPEAAKLAARVRKDLLRGFVLVGGYASSEGCGGMLTDAIRDMARLDAAVDRLPLDMDVRCLEFLKRQGVEPYKQTTYKQACQEGWAPAPTNEFQQAIWNEVHSTPQTPMKIKFDPKQGR